MTRVGLRLGTSQARAVVLEEWPRRSVRAVEVPFDPDRPDEGIEAMRGLVGKPRRIAIVIDLQLLRAKRIKLPALSAVERRNILRLEPERFFAVRGSEVVPAVRPDDELVFAVDATALERWVAAAERIAPVDLVEATPIALARALTGASIKDAFVLFDGRDAGIGIAEIRGGQLTRARRLFGTPSQCATALATDGFEAAGLTVAYVDPWTEEGQAAFLDFCPGVPLEPLPSLGRAGHGDSVAGPFLAAYGAAMAIENPPPISETLVSSAQETKIARRRARSVGAAVATCAAAFLFLVASVDSRRNNEERQLNAAIADLTARAAPTLAMQTELVGLSRRSDAVRAIEAERLDPVRVLRALSAALPSGAFVRQVRGDSTGWQVDGYAPNASAVLTALGSGASFRDVHFLSATNRAQIANQAYESFSLAFRFVPAS